MQSTTHLWQSVFSAAISAIVVETADCLLAGCGAGTVILGLRAGTLAAACAFFAVLLAHLVFFNRSVRFKVLVSVFTMFPLAIWSALHLSQTATVVRILPLSLRLWVPYIGMQLLCTAYFFSIVQLRHAPSQRPPGPGSAKIHKQFTIAFFMLFLAGALFLNASNLKKLHYPLAVTSLIFCWLSLQIVTDMLTRRLALKTIQIGTAATICAGITMFCWPVSLEDAFIASDQGIVSRNIAGIGRAHTMSELVAKVSPIHPQQLHSPPSVAMLPQLPGRSIVLISVDALRPDHLGFHGYPRNTSPTIDALLRQSVVFKNAFATAPTSSFSIPSIHAGMAMEEHLKSNAPIPPMLATQLAHAGYDTIGLYPPKVFSMGPTLMGKLEQHQFGFQSVEILKMDAKSDIQAALAILRARTSEKPLFMWVHLFDPHLPYSCHNQPFGQTQKDCYDAEIAYLDEQLKPFLDEVKNRLNSPIIAFTADHGEAFGEHGRFYHSTDLYNEQIRVPLAFRVEGVLPSVVDAPVSNTSIFDTLISLVQPDSSGLENDLRPYMVSRGFARPVLSAIDTKRSVIFDRHKLICENWPDGACALFSLAGDPGEKHNLAGRNLQKTVDLLGILKASSEHGLARLRDTAPEAIILGRLKRPGATQGLLSLANQPASPYKAEAARLLAFLKDVHLGDELGHLMESQNAEVAAWASIGRGLIGESLSNKTLYPYLNSDTDLGYWSAIVLGRQNDNRAFQPLLQQLKHVEPEIRAQSALALGQLGNPHAVPALISLLQIKQSRWAAIEALGALEDRRALHVLNSLKMSEPDINNLPRYEKAIERIENN